jgi:hypothetical protein
MKTPRGIIDKRKLQKLAELSCPKCLHLRECPKCHDDSKRQLMEKLEWYMKKWLEGRGLKYEDGTLKPLNEKQK